MEQSDGASPTIAVLLGGSSAEREVSLSTGRECIVALQGEGFDVVEIDPGLDLVQKLADLKPSAVFNALHGRWGEDGCVQGILEWLQIPYTHSGVLASALAMDKQRSKAAFSTVGLPTAKSIICCKADVAAGHVLPPPYVVKPNNEGSSVGVYILHEYTNGPPRLDDTMPDYVMVETFVPGRELTVTVLGDKPLTVTEIHAEGWYDYHAKYARGGSTHTVPAQLPRPIFDLCMDYALRAHQVLGCRGISRSDFRWDDSLGPDGLYLLETNTQPGMTPTSLAPEQAESSGISFSQLCKWLVEDASCNR